MTIQNSTLPINNRYSAKILLLIVFLVTIYFIANNLGQTLQIFWLIGLSVGFVLQRSRLCFASGFRDLFLMKQGTTMKGILAGLGIAIIGFTMVMSGIYPEPNGVSIPSAGNILPVGIATIAGGLLFGVSMVLAGGCVSGSLYRMGEGYLTSWVAMVGIIIGNFILNQTWNWWWEFSIYADPLTWLPNEIGYSAAIFLSLSLLLIAYIVIVKIETSEPTFIPPTITKVQNNLSEQKTNFIQNFYPTLTKIFKNGWSPVIGASVLAIINIIVFTRFAPLGVVGEISRWGAYIGDFFGIATPSLKGVSSIGGCSLDEMITGNFFAHNHFFMNTGIVVGSFSAALIANEFKLRISKSFIRYIQSFIGGIGMGYGAGLAIGCTIGAFFSAIPSLALSGWVFAFSLFVGAFIGSKIITKLM